MKKAIFVGLVAAAVMLSVATPAQADSDGDLAVANAEAQFMSDVTRAGFQNPYGPQQQLADGIHTCLNIGPPGGPRGSTAAEQARLLWSYGHLTQYQAAQFVNIAISDLCPWNR
jgi:hypothetical protein